MKKIKYLLLVCAVAVCLAGCSDATEEITSENIGNSEIVENESSEETVDSEEVVGEEETIVDGEATVVANEGEKTEDKSLLGSLLDKLKG